MYAETVLVDAVHIVVLAHIDPVAIMVSIAAPHEIMDQQLRTQRIPSDEEGVDAPYMAGGKACAFISSSDCTALLLSYTSFLIRNHPICMGMSIKASWSYQSWL